MPNPPPPLPNPTTAPLPPSGTGSANHYPLNLVVVPATVASTPEVGGWKPSPGDNSVLACRFEKFTPSKRRDRRIDQFTESESDVQFYLPTDPGDLVYVNAVVRLLKDPNNVAGAYWLFQALGPALPATELGGVFVEYTFEAVLVTV